MTGAFPRRVGHEKPFIFVQTHFIAQKSRTSRKDDYGRPRRGDEARLIGTPAGHPTCTGKTMRSSPLCGLDSKLAGPGPFLGGLRCPTR